MRDPATQRPGHGMDRLLPAVTSRLEGGLFPALYNAVEPETAVVAALADRRRRGLPDTEALPMVLVAQQVNITGVLNLSDGRVRRTLGVSLRRLIAAWRPDQEHGREALIQALGRLAREIGFQAIRYKSAWQVLEKFSAPHADARPKGLRLASAGRPEPRQQRGARKGRPEQRNGSCHPAVQRMYRIVRQILAPKVTPQS